MKSYLTEDQITDIFAHYLELDKWHILERARGKSRGADIVAIKNGRRLCIEAKGGGSQSVGSARYGQAFSRRQCNSHTDVAFASIPRMVARYNPNYVGIVLPDDKFHFESVDEILPAIKQLGAGLWLVSGNGTRAILRPKSLHRHKLIV